jgi:hypothetical protein
LVRWAVQWGALEVIHRDCMVELLCPLCALCGVVGAQVWNIGRPSLHAFVRAVAYYTFLLSLPFWFVDYLASVFYGKNMLAAGLTERRRSE